MFKSLSPANSEPAIYFSHYLEGPAIGKQFSTVFAITNIVSMLMLPKAALASSTVFMALPVLWMGSALNTLNNGFSCCINQSAKEALYVPTAKDKKYKAKVFIDMLVEGSGLRLTLA
jgi:AAA family ATP:ADP antiporter